MCCSIPAITHGARPHNVERVADPGQRVVGRKRFRHLPSASSADIVSVEIELNRVRARRHVELTDLGQRAVEC